MTSGPWIWTRDCDAVDLIRMEKLLYLGHSETSGALEPNEFYQLFCVLMFLHQLSPDYQMEDMILQDHSCFLFSEQ